MDIQPHNIEAALAKIAPIFRDTPQFVDERLAQAVGRTVLVKVETLNPIGSFKARGASLLAPELDPTKTWVAATAGNFGQALAYLARERSAAVHILVSPDVPAIKVDRIRALGAVVEIRERPEAAARAFAEAAPAQRLLVVDGSGTAMAEGAGTIGVEIAAPAAPDTAIVQIGDGALITGIACWLKAVSPQTKVIGVCARGAPAMAKSFAAGRPIASEGDGTIATAIAVTDPLPESVARVVEVVDQILLVDDDDLRRAMRLIADTLGLLVEPAGAAGLAALMRHPQAIPGERVATILTGSGASHPTWNIAV
jgi:threonine dehydratase